MGRRKNKPAQNYWFVPGGRIQKGEKIHEAVLRISLAEFGVPALFNDMELIGVFDHIYNDNVFGEEGYGTHSITIGYQIKLNNEDILVNNEQHVDFRWFGLSEIHKSVDVHPNTRLYFRL